MSENIYEPPTSDVRVESTEQNELASRWKRLWASLLDSLILMLIILPVMYFTGGFEGVSAGVQPSMGYSLLMGLFGLIVFVLVNGKLLVDNGQTIGKKILGIKIITDNGELPTLKEHLLKRYAVFFLPGQIPLVGQIFSIVNVVFIFGKQKRCIHDIAGGTKVVTA